MLNRIIIILSCAVLTFMLRAFPFLILQKKEMPKRMRYLGNMLPMAIMATLVIYCLKEIPGGSFLEALPLLAGVAVTTIMHLWKRNTILSILAGTIVYMVLIRL